MFNLTSTAARLLFRAKQGPMGKAMQALSIRTSFISLIFVLFSFVCMALVCTPCAALAASWQWEKTSMGERIIIDLAAGESLPQGARPVMRTGVHTLTLPLGGNVTLVQGGNAPEAGSLMANVLTAEGSGLQVNMQDSAFGYLARQPNAQQIVLDIYKDPLGARWQPDGKLAPQGTQAQKLSASVLPSASPAQPIPSQPEIGIEAPSMPPESTALALPATALPTPAEEQSAPTVTSATENLPVQGAFGALNDGDASQPFENASAVDAASQAEPDVAPAMPPENPPAMTPLDMPLESVLVEEEPQSEAKESFVPASLNPVREANAAALEPQPTEPQAVDIQSTETRQAITPPSTTKEPENSAEVAEKVQQQSDTPVTQDIQAPAQVVDNAAATTKEVFTPNRGKAQIISPQELTGTVNKNGPQSWPDEEGITTNLPETVTQSTEGAENTEGAVEGEQVQVTQGPDDAVRQSIDPASKPAVEEAEAERPIKYVDEEGNEVPKPPEPDELFTKALNLMDEGKNEEALPIFEQLKGMSGVSRERYEQILYLISDITVELYEGKPLEGFDPIERTTSEALNANLRSTRVPDALFRLGMAHLNVHNFDEAEGYFQALKRRFPYDQNVPDAFFLLGNGLLEKGFYADAVEHFRSVLQEFPDSSVLQKTTIGMVKALTRLKDFKEAAVFAEFADMRWARHYIEDPDYLYYLAEIDYAQGKKEQALGKYWLLYNLLPKDEKASDILARIGDLYFELNKNSAALEVFAEAQTRFPGTAAAALGLLRAAEKGMYDSPITKAEMFAVFENPGEPLPQVAYKTLLEERPKDPRTITAKLKYALWQLWDKEYTDAMGTAADFIDLYPENVDVHVARDVIMDGFMADLKNSMLEENYGRILTLWNGFPLVRERYGPIDADLRNALARGYLERGDDAMALELFAEFLKTPKHPRYSDPTFALYFNKYLASGNWNGMLDLGEIVKDWEMTKSMRGQLDYALALSAENLGLREKSLDLWKELAVNMDIPLYQRAYATYFLAKDAETRRDIKEAYAYNLKTLELFEQLKEDRSDKADDARRKEAMGALMDITEVANRIPEALEWVDRYNQFVPEGSPEHPGLRFREARLYRKLGNNDKAKMLLEAIVRDSAGSPFATAARTELGTFNVSRDLQNFLPQSSAQ